MRSILTIFFFLFSISFFAQGNVSYNVLPIPLGATEFTVEYYIDVPNPPEGEAIIFGSLELQIIDKALVDDVFAVGENILTINIPNFVTGNTAFNSSQTYELPAGMSFQENLPDNKVYRLVDNNYNGYLLFDVDTNENTGNGSIDNVTNSSIPNLEEMLIIGGNSQESNINVSFTNRSASVLKTSTSFTISTSITANLDDIFDSASVKFQIHIVDDANLFTMENVSPQELISESAFMPIFNGDSNIDFTLQTPDDLSSDLPSGKSYRIRLVNEDFNTHNAYPLPYELSVVSTLSTIGFSEKETVYLYPNPAQESISVNSKKNIEKYKIFDVTGTLVTDKKTSTNILSVNHLTPGIYFLDTSLGIHKFIKK